MQSPPEKQASQLGGADLSLNSSILLSNLGAIFQSLSPPWDMKSLTLCKRHCGTQNLGNRLPKQTHPRAADASDEVLLLASSSCFPYLYNGDMNAVISGMLMSA